VLAGCGSVNPRVNRATSPFGLQNVTKKLQSNINWAPEKFWKILNIDWIFILFNDNKKWLHPLQTHLHVQHYRIVIILIKTLNKMWIFHGSISKHVSLKPKLSFLWFICRFIFSFFFSWGSFTYDVHDLGRRGGLRFCATF